MKRVFLIKIDDIKRYSFIDENVSDQDIMNTLIDVQETMLEELLGTELYEYLVDTIADNQNNLTVEDHTLITKKIHKVLIHGTAFKIVINKLFRITRTSVLKDDNKNSRAVEIKELNTMRAERERVYAHHANKLVMFLRENESDYPKYTELTDDGIDPSHGIQPSSLYIDEETEDYINKINLRNED